MLWAAAEFRERVRATAVEPVAQAGGAQGHIKDGHGVLYRDCFMGPTKESLCRIHVLWLCSLAEMWTVAHFASDAPLERMRALSSSGT